MYMAAGCACQSERQVIVVQVVNFAVHVISNTDFGVMHPCLQNPGQTRFLDATISSATAYEPFEVLETNRVFEDQNNTVVYAAKSQFVLWFVSILFIGAVVSICA